jgi:hypothetical protein
MAPQKSRHATAVTLVGDALRVVFGAGVTVRVQLPFALDDRSEPEPDVAIVAGLPGDYRDPHPDRALLLCEVSDTTVAYDRGLGGLSGTRPRRLRRAAIDLCRCLGRAPGPPESDPLGEGSAALRSGPVARTSCPFRTGD